MSLEQWDSAEADSGQDDTDEVTVAPKTNTENVGDWYSDSMPNAPPATDGPNEDTIWFDTTEDPEWAQEVAEAMNYPDASEMDVVATIIRDDFREFFIPLNSSFNVFENNLEMLKDRHLSDARKYNDEITYDHTVKDLDIGGGAEEKQANEDELVDWDSVMDEAEEEEPDIDLGGAFDDM